MAISGCENKIYLYFLPARAKEFYLGATLIYNLFRTAHATAILGTQHAITTPKNPM